jgi:hypothetical protein
MDNGIASMNAAARDPMTFVFTYHLLNLFSALVGLIAGRFGGLCHGTNSFRFPVQILENGLRYVFGQIGAHSHVHDDRLGHPWRVLLRRRMTTHAVVFVCLVRINFVLICALSSLGKANRQYYE